MDIADIRGGLVRWVERFPLKRSLLIDMSGVLGRISDRFEGRRQTKCMTSADSKTETKHNNKGDAGHANQTNQ